MSGGYPLKPSWCNWGSNATQVYNGGGVSITSPVTPDTYGAWTTIQSALPNDIDGMIISIFGGIDACAVQLGIGGSGSEVVVLPDFIVPNDHQAIYLPISLPSGTRISMRAKNHAGSGAPNVVLSWWSDAFNSGCNFQMLDSIGVTGTTQGTSVSWTTVNTLGAYSQLTASASSDYVGFYIRVDDLNGTYNNQSDVAVSIAVGGSGNEVELCRIYALQGFVGIMDSIIGIAMPIMCNIPAGSRISAAAISSNPTGASFGVSLVAIRE